MAAEFDLDVGYDPTSSATINASQMKQITAQALPKATKAIIIYDNPTPDIASNPRYAGYLWMRPADNPKILRYFDTGSSSWQPIVVAAGSVITTSIANLAVTLAKLSASGGAPGQLMRVNGAGNGIEFYTFAITNGSITLAQFAAPGVGNENLFLCADSGATGLEYRAFDPTNDIATGGMSISKLAAAISVTYKVLASVGGANTWIDVINAIAAGTLPISVLQQSAPKYSPRMNLAGNGWEYSLCTALVPTSPKQLLFNSSALVVNTWYTIDVSAFVTPGCTAILLESFIRFVDPAVQHSMGIDFSPDSGVTNVYVHRVTSQVNGLFAAGDRQVYLPIKLVGAVYSISYRVKYNVDVSGADAALPATYAVSAFMVGQVY